MSFLKGVRQGMRNFGHLISVLVNTALLLVVYLLGVGVTSLIARISGKQFLQMKQGKKSYWSDLDLKKRPLEAHYRQF